MLPPNSGIPLPPRIASGPMPGSPVAGGPPDMAALSQSRGLPIPPGMMAPPMSAPQMGAAAEVPPPMSPEEQAILDQLVAQDMGQMPPVAPTLPELQPQSGAGKKYDVEEQADGSLVIFENTNEGGRVARKIVPLGKSAAANV